MRFIVLIKLNSLWYELSANDIRVKLGKLYGVFINFLFFFYYNILYNGKYKCVFRLLKFNSMTIIKHEWHKSETSRASFYLNVKDKIQIALLWTIITHSAGLSIYLHSWFSQNTEVTTTTTRDLPNGWIIISHRHHRTTLLGCCYCCIARIGLIELKITSFCFDKLYGTIYGVYGWVQTAPHCKI